MRRMLSVAVAGLSVLSACGDKAPEAARSPATTGAASVPLAPAPSHACGWLPQEEVAGIAGPLAGKPRVVRSLERPDQSDATGSACRYDLEGGRAIVLQVDLSGGIVQERVVGTMAGQFRQAVRSMTESGSDSVASSPVSAGWDHTGTLLSGYATFTGRVGHIAISVASPSPGVERATTIALAERVRDAMPDLPFLLPPDPELAALAAAAGETLDEIPSGPDPCGLISAAEAEAVLGRLLVPPYRAAEGSPLAHPGGTACAYFTRGHRVFVVQPRWNSGQMLFRMAEALGGVAVAAIGEPDGAAADTLEGAWDASSGSSVTGKLYFLKGDRMLEVDYVTSSTDMAGATRLAGIAIKRVAP